MTTDDTLAFVQRLHELYEQFHITPALMKMWHQELGTIDGTDLQEALRRYVLDALPQYPPTLNRLLDLVDGLRRERKRGAWRADQGTFTAVPYEKALEQAAGQVPFQDHAWAKEHCAMYLAGVAKPGKEAEAVAWCERKAQEYPADAADWHKEARAYRWELEAREAEGDVGAGDDLSDVPF